MMSAWWLTACVRRLNPCEHNWRTMISSIGLSPTGTSGLGNATVYGLSRVPRPPAKITARFSTIVISPCLWALKLLGHRRHRHPVRAVDREASGQAPSRAHHDCGVAHCLPYIAWCRHTTWTEVLSSTGGDPRSA